METMLAPKLGETVHRYTSSSRFYPGTIVSIADGWVRFEDDGCAPIAQLRWHALRLRWEYLP